MSACLHLGFRSMSAYPNVSLPQCPLTPMSAYPMSAYPHASLAQVSLPPCQIILTSAYPHASLPYVSSPSCQLTTISAYPHVSLPLCQLISKLNPIVSLFPVPEGIGFQSILTGTFPITLKLFQFYIETLLYLSSGFGFCSAVMLHKRVMYN